MSMQIDKALPADELSFTEESDTPIDAWTLTELAAGGELASLRSAWAGTDDFTV